MNDDTQIPGGGSARVAPVTLFMTCNDRSVLQAINGEIPASETLRRFHAYAEELRRRFGKESRLVVFALGRRRKGKLRDFTREGLFIQDVAYGIRLFFAAGLLVQMLRHSLGGRPTIITSQSVFEDGEVAYLVARIRRAKWVPQVHFDPFGVVPKGVRAQALRWYEAWLLHRADWVRTVSHTITEEIMKRYGIDRSRIHCAPVPVFWDLEHDDRSRKEIRARLAPDWVDCRVMLYVARMYEPKDPYFWVDVAASVSERAADVRFLMVGGGRLLEDVKRYAAAKLDERRITFWGEVDAAGVRDAYKVGDVLFLSSKSESFGRVILEAIAGGVPVVATRCTGPAEVLHRCPEALVQHGDAAGAASRVLAVLDSESAGLSRVQAGILADYGSEKLLRQVVAALTAGA